LELSCQGRIIKKPYFIAGGKKMFRYYVPSNFRELDHMQRRMERMARAFSPFYNGPAGYPAVNVWFKEDELMVSAELPGFTPEAINLSVLGDTLTLSGSRKEEELPENAQYHRNECAFGDFNRTIRLPFSVDADQVNATYENGLLTVKLVRAEADKPRKINVKSN
jgi:HSP20 family protein